MTGGPRSNKYTFSVNSVARENCPVVARRAKPEAGGETTNKLLINRNGEIAMSENVIINKQFTGPPGYGQGGYICGMVAELVGGAAEVTLRQPAPLEKPLQVQRFDEGDVAISDGDTLIAKGSPVTFDIDVPSPVSFSEAEAASKSYWGIKQHPVPSCFVCSPQIPVDIGLGIFPGPIEERSMVATPWKPPARLNGADGKVDSKFLWAALDCPSGWALVHAGFMGSAVPLHPAVLGRLSGKISEPVEVGQQCIVIGWSIGMDGRKGYAGSAIYSSSGDLHAVGRATWIKI
jgi:hypothetical protein